MINTKIIGTGSFIPSLKITNDHFISNDFYDSKGQLITKDNRITIDKLEEITTISERRYVKDEYVTSDIAYFAAKAALESSNIDKETLDYIIVAHNFGDVKKGQNAIDIVPSLAARVKFKLGIENPNTVAYDLPFGCPGWLQGVIQTNYYLKSGDAKRALVIGAEVLSRVIDEHDRDSMLYADGAGATILEATEELSQAGVLAHKTRSDTLEYSEMLFMGESYNNTVSGLFLKMHGRKLYQYALETVPQAIKACLDKSGIHISEVNKVLIHQANGKMDDAILKRLYKLYNINEVPHDVMPMTISWLGNSSVATVPTLLDLILKENIEGQQIKSGDVVVFASVGAGMNINALVYKV